MTDAEQKQASMVYDKEAEEMFAYWVEHNRNYAATGRKFKRATTTVRRTAARFEWLDRADQIKEKIQRNVDNQIAKKEFSNLEVVRAMKNTVAASILERLKDKRYKPTISDYIGLLKYEDEFTGGGTPNPDGNTTNNYFLGSVNIANNFNESEKRKLDANLAGYYGRRGADRFCSQN